MCCMETITTEETKTTRTIFKEFNFCYNYAKMACKTTE